MSLASSPRTPVPLAAKIARLCNKRQSSVSGIFASNSSPLNGPHGRAFLSTQVPSNLRQQRSQKDKACSCKDPVSQSFGYFPGTLNTVYAPRFWMRWVYGCTKAGKKSKGCWARLIEDKQGKITVTGHHNHPPQILSAEKAEFYKALKQAVQTEKIDNRMIYKRLSMDLRFRDVAVHYPYKKVKRIMSKWRKGAHNRCTAKIKSIDDYVKFFQTPEDEKFLTYDEGRKLSYCLVDEGEGKQHLILYDKTFLEENKGAKVIQADSTFLASANIHRVTQLLTLMARNYDRISRLSSIVFLLMEILVLYQPFSGLHYFLIMQAFPCIWVLMTSKTAASYQKVLTKIKEDIWPELEPKEFIADFEGAFEIAVKKVYSKAEITGCYFHFCQALIRNAIKKHAAIHRNLQKNTERHLVLRQVMALAFLPEDDIFPTLKEIEEAARGKYGNYFDEFFSYIRSYWMER
ncbi:hypothetical protein QAD02_021748 [Eretmocerus hayati]|uniref:Uncharacterized protein n=1 Tax=Eretmocerus hayati TaxID=131215 RepID=A0ACC2PRC1_9HYME|nr:hypothetical protein QAD02_021748 [Eretmocerus hayati]